MTKLRMFLVTIPVAAVIGYLWFGRETHRASADPVLSATPQLVAPGRVEPMRDPVLLAFETSGRIVAIDVEEGIAVKQGQVLARLDDRLPAARVAAAKAGVAGAEARYALALRGPRHEDIAAAKAEVEAAAAAAEH